MAHTILQWDKREVQLFCLAVFLRLFAAILLFVWYEPFPIAGSDSQSYLSAAHYFLADGRFVAEDGISPNSYEMPAYSLFVAVMEGIGGLALISLLQCLLLGFTTVLIYRIGKIFSVRVGSGAALLFACDPVGVFYSGFILTESLFLFFFVCAVYFATTSILLFRSAFLPGALLGIATMVRPVGEVLALAFILFYLFQKPVVWKKYLAPPLLFSIAFMLVVGPWIVRNKILFDRTELSAVAAWQFAYAHAPLFYAYQNNISDKEAIRIFHKRLLDVSPYDEDINANRAGTLSNAPYLWQVAFEYIGEHPVAFAYFHAVKTIPFFLSDGWRELAGRLGIIDNNLPNIGNLLLRMDIGGFASALAREPFAFALLFFGSLFWGVVVCCMVAGLWRYIRVDAHSRRLMMLLACLIVIMAGVAGGVVSHPRYRYSVTPFMFVLAALGVEQIIAMRGSLTQMAKHFKVLP